MTFGDIIEKFLGLFGVPPGNQRALSKRIKVLKKKRIKVLSFNQTCLLNKRKEGKHERDQISTEICQGVSG